MPPPPGCTYLYELTAVPNVWPLETVVDAFLHLACYDPAYRPGAEPGLLALRARLLDLWVLRPVEATAWLAQQQELYERHLGGKETKEARLAELLFQHGRSERSRCYVNSFSDAGLVRVAGSWVFSPQWEAILRPRCSELAGQLPAADAQAQADETAPKRHRLEERREEQQLAERLEAVESELQAAKEEVAQHKTQNEQLSAGLEDAQAAAAEKQRELQAAKHECELLTERLQAMQDEGAAQKEQREQLARRLAAAEAEAAGKRSDVQRLQDECDKHKECCAQLTNRLAVVETSTDKADVQTLLENAVLKDRCELLGQQVSKAEAKLEEKLGQMQEEKGVYKERCRQLERQLAEAKEEAKCLKAQLLSTTPASREEASGPGSKLAEQSGVAKAGGLVTGQAVEVSLESLAAALQVMPGHAAQVDALGELAKLLHQAAGKLAVGDLVVLDSGDPEALSSIHTEPSEGEELQVVFEPDLPHRSLLVC
ncbi:unnamed protein product [Symbiodinium natans]|uniref:Uncharacterized protein n=1 Tax=Symbiodinium natans TaxID=878477 RepID=A0A812TB21_9DINO|nr:unnamed protein product [Symbiodinium natans]